MPLSEKEKATSVGVSKASGDAFFAARKKNSQQSTASAPATTLKLDFCKLVADMTSDRVFCDKHGKTSAPLAVVALASVVQDTLLKSKDGSFEHRFNGLTFTVPPCSSTNPHYHSIVGHRLLHVDWPRTFGIQLSCPDAQCKGKLQNNRSNFSKNKILFPLFGLDGAQSWCIVQSMTCDTCRRRHDANHAAALLTLPTCAAEAYPVEMKYAFTNRTSHLTRNATETFDMLMLTYGNGELCSKLLYNSINREHIQKLKVCLSWLNHHQNATNKVQPYLQKDSKFIKTFPPLGDTIREMYREACKTEQSSWVISDDNRNTREIQSVSLNGSGVFGEDHTL